MESFEQIFVQNEESRQLLHDIGFDNVIIAGDTRFDRVAAIAQAAKQIPLVERFKGDSRLFVAGSTWGPDEDILQQLINQNPDIKFVVAPHEMDEERMAKIIANTAKSAVRYTQCDEQTDLSHCQVLILDTIGILSSIYGYATWSYIGGGFGVGIHNTLEAATFALPIAFGPNYKKFKEACDLIQLGAAASITTYEELAAWFAPLRDEEQTLAERSRIARDYTRLHQGATQLITSTIFPHKA